VLSGAVVPLLINNASVDPRFQDHPGLHIYGIESYIAVPLHRQDGSYFGTLCALDPKPANLSEDAFDLFNLLSQLIAFELEAEENQHQKEVQHEAFTQFVSTASHNLKTPLTALRLGVGAVGTSMADRIRPGEQRLLENARRNIDRLNIHVNDLLTFNQSEADALYLESSPIDLRTIVTNALAACYSLISEQGHIVEIDLPDPLEIEGDFRRLEQVIVNLLENALHYSPPDRPITISGRARDNKVHLVVSDGGPGIPVEHRELIFERFYRISSATNGSGSGLGLAIARTIINIHGGQIWVMDDAEGGAAFHIELPRHRSTEECRR
jgi:signal transduction histidine kinase